MTLAIFATLAELPDADVFAVMLGASDYGPAGHRGASHSLFAAVLIGGLCALVARRLGWPPLRSAIAGTLAVASHGLLDAVAEGQRGIPLFWPFSDERFLSPWRVLPDAPRGLGLLAPHGLSLVAVEFLVFLPLTWFALRTPRAARAVEAAAVAVPVPMTVIEGGRSAADAAGGSATRGAQGRGDGSGKDDEHEPPAPVAAAR